MSNVVNDRDEGYPHDLDRAESQLQKTLRQRFAVEHSQRRHHALEELVVKKILQAVGRPGWSKPMAQKYRERTGERPRLSFHELASLQPRFPEWVSARRVLNLEKDGVLASLFSPRGLFQKSSRIYRAYRQVVEDEAQPGWEDVVLVFGPVKGLYGGHLVLSNSERQSCPLRSRLSIRLTGGDAAQLWMCSFADYLEQLPLRYRPPEELQW